MTPKLINNNGTPEIIGNFTFSSKQIIYNETETTIYKTFSFDWDTDFNQDDMIKFGEDNIIEMFSEKLKQDFKKLIYTKL